MLIEQKVINVGTYNGEQWEYFFNRGDDGRHLNRWLEKGWFVKFLIERNKCEHNREAVVILERHIEPKPVFLTPEEYSKV